MKLLGIEYLIVTNAAGGIRDVFRVGDVVLLKNHVNMVGLAGFGPLVGPNDSEFGERFPPMKFPYDLGLLKVGRVVAKEIGINSKVHQGVYGCVAGPSYETLAEVKYLRAAGVDMVGMSTVHETITAVHCGLKVFGFSLITDTAVDEAPDKQEITHDDVMEVGSKYSVDISRFVERFCEKLKLEIEKGKL